MSRLSYEFCSRSLIPDAGEPLPWNIDDMCPQCGTFCEHHDAAEHFYTPPQSPAEQSFNFKDNRKALNSPISPTAPSQSATPRYPSAPPSTPITAQSEYPIQLWSSDLYKTTINFSPSELPEYLHDGAWRHMQTHGEMSILFGPEAARPFNATHASASDVNSKFFWGPLKVDASGKLLPPQGGPSVEPQVRARIEGTANSLDSEQLVVGNELEV